MKMIIQQKAFVDALEKGALAALSDEAQTDTSIISVLIKSVKIKTDGKNFTVESATKLMSTKCVTPLNDEIEVKDEGEILVQAKELYDWVKRQTGSKLALSLSKLDTPDIINPLENESDGTLVKGIKRIGIVKVVSKDESKTGVKWEFDCYAADQLGESDMTLPQNKKFDISVKQLNDGLRAVSFAIMPKHYQHLYDSISFQPFNSKIYMIASDTARAAIYEATDVKNNALDINLLVPTKFLASVAKLADPAIDVSFSFDEKNNKIFFSQKDSFIVKMSTADVALIAKFPPVKLLLNKSYKQLAELQKGTLANRLMTTILVNDSAALFNFKSNQMFVHAISSSGKKPLVANMPVTNLDTDFVAVWGVNHILDFLKILKDDSVCVYVPETDKGSVKFLSKQDPNWSYYVMAQDAKKTKYDQVKVD